MAIYEARLPSSLKISQLKIEYMHKINVAGSIAHFNESGLKLAEGSTRMVVFI